MTALLAALILAAPVELVVDAAVSLRESFGALAQRFEKQHSGVRVRLDLAGSQELRTQIEHGAKADVFASADMRHLHALHRAGLAEAPRVFARNELALVVPRHNPGRIARFEDLIAAKRIVLAAPEVPAGVYADEILAKGAAELGPEFRRQVLGRVVSRELNVRQVLTKVALGEADAGIVYRTDIAAGGDRVTTVPIPASLNVAAEYPVAALANAPQPELAREFVRFVLSAEGQSILRGAGFLPPP